MTDYTPTTDQVRARYCAGWTGSMSNEYGEAFDRWLEQVKAEAPADAGLLARPLPTRDEIAMSIAARHWDRDSGDVDVWHDLTDSEKENVAENYLTWDSADAVLALLKGQDR